MKVIFQKPDMDTCLTALIMGVEPDDDIIFSRGDASKADLADRAILCIEAGGAGQIRRRNFDHHVAGRNDPPACIQALRYRKTENKPLVRLAEYVGLVDEARHQVDPIPFPSLSAIFSGMLLMEQNPIQQLFNGVAIFRDVLDHQFDPFQSMPDYGPWRAYRDAKRENLLKNEGILANSVFFSTCGGRMLGFVETDAFGGRSRLYAAGCDVAIMLHPAFGTPPLPKYTIASNVVPVMALIPHFDCLEKGWGGKRGIIGSPRRGTALTRRQIIELAIQHL